MENSTWVKITKAEAEIIRKKGLTWASDIILSRLRMENTHYIGDYDLKTCIAALNTCEADKGA
jgi:hypothetical protein